MIPKGCDLKKTFLPVKAVLGEHWSILSLNVWLYIHLCIDGW